MITWAALARRAGHVFETPVLSIDPIPLLFDLGGIYSYDKRKEKSTFFKKKFFEICFIFSLFSYRTLLFTTFRSDFVVVFFVPTSFKTTSTF